ncbi:MAG: M16 family metallopeptidase [Candidatus Cryptobacteroides sp.]
MKKIIKLAAGILCLMLASCSQYKYETVKNDPLGTKIYTLDNGLKVYMSVNKETPRIQTYIAVKVGGKNDPIETTGLAHYFEHLMFKGSTHFGTSDYEAEKPMLDEIEQLFEVYRKTKDEAQRKAIYHKIDSISYEASKIAIPNEYDKLMSIIGAEGTNAFTSMDMTVYVEDIPSNQIENWAKIEADRFKNPVLRGFHTELETIYEEKNMSLTQDSRKIWEALDAALYPNHPYGRQTVLGTQEHLKNPSITNVKKYHDTWYRPNNMAICLSGDFNPDEMVATIEKYFGDMEPNNEFPTLEFEAEEPITTPVVKEVFGPESEAVVIAWRMPAAKDHTNDIADLASSILYNDKAGLLDLDINQKQKALGMYAFSSTQPDYSQFIIQARPKQGQSLEELKALALEEIAKLRDGNFDESLIRSTINNYKLNEEKGLESNDNRAMSYVYSFINGVEWSDEVGKISRIEKLTKEDIVAWANEYLKDDNYAVVYKRQGTDPDEQKIAAPKITPIETNRNVQSDYLTEIQNTEVKPIEPVFVDYNKDMSQFDIKGLHVLYKNKAVNDVSQLGFVYNTGSNNDPALSFAIQYLQMLGTPTMSHEEFASKLYALACDVYIPVSAYYTSFYINGLDENLGAAMDLVEELVNNAQPDENILAELKADLLKSRADSKLRQRSCYSALQRYLTYGPDFIKRNTLTDGQIKSLTSEELLAKVKDLYYKGHEIRYYGASSRQGLTELIAGHHTVADNPTPLEQEYVFPIEVKEPVVLIAPYDAKQIYYMQYSNRGEKFNYEATPALNLYNEYFGGGMNTIVFQEMREARGLAYSAWATMAEPYYKDMSYYYMAFIATQNDKMKQAIEAFDEIINNMPQSEQAFAVAKEAMISKMRTNRVVGYDVINSFIDARDMGRTESMDSYIFEKIQDMTLEDIVKIQQEWVAGRTYAYGILGDKNDLDLNYLKTLGEIKYLTLTDIFGY